MGRKLQKISYIKKPFAAKSLVSLGFGAAALLCLGVSLALSACAQGRGDVNVAAWGLSSMLFSVAALGCGTAAFGEKEKNYVLAKIGIGTGIFLLVVWLILIGAGMMEPTAS